jgi:hypothetical protein
MSSLYIAFRQLGKIDFVEDRKGGQFRDRIGACDSQSNTEERHQNQQAARPRRKVPLEA